MIYFKYIILYISIILGYFFVVWPLELGEIIAVIIITGAFYFINHSQNTQLKREIQTLEEKYFSVPILTISQVQELKKPVKTRLITSHIVITGGFFMILWASLRNVFGGSVGAYEKILNMACQLGLQRLKAQANNAIGILNIRYQTSMINPKITEIIVYGTLIEKDNDEKI